LKKPPVVVDEKLVVVPVTPFRPDPLDPRGSV